MKRTKLINSLGLAAATSVGITATKITSKSLSKKKLKKKLNSSVPFAVITTNSIGYGSTTSTKKMKALSGKKFDGSVLAVVTADKHGVLTAHSSKKISASSASTKNMSLKKIGKNGISAAYSAKTAKKAKKLKTSSNGTSTVAKPLTLNANKKTWISA